MAYGLGFARSATLAYNDGVAATGCTSPLWAVLLGALHALAGASSPSWSVAHLAKALGVLLHATTAALAALTAARVVPSPRASVIAGVAAAGLCALDPALLFGAASGMEVSLTTALAAGAMLALSHARLAATGVLVGLCVLARPEALVMLGPVVVAVMLARGGAGWRSALRLLGPALLIVGLGVLRTWMASGRPLPATFYHKAFEVRVSPWTALAMTWRYSLSTTPGLGGVWRWALAALALIAVRRRGRADVGGVAAVSALGWVVGSGVVATPITETFYSARYVHPAIPLLVVGAVRGAAVLVGAMLARRGYSRARPLALASGAVVLLACASLVLELPRARQRLADDVTTIDRLQVRVGTWLASATAPTAVVWTIDAGAIRYWGQRRTVDLIGLNTPELVAGGRVPEHWWPDTVVLIPAFFSLHVDGRAASRVAVFDVPRYTVSRFQGLRRHSVYRCAAPRPGGVGDELWVGHRGASASHAAPLAVGRCRPVAQ